MNNTDLDLEDPDFERPYSSDKSPESAIVSLNNLNISFMILWNIKYIAKVVLHVRQPNLRTGYITYRMFHHVDHGFVHR
jgi:hypothetical protein